MFHIIFFKNIFKVHIAKVLSHVTNQNYRGSKLREYILFQKIHHITGIIGNTRSSFNPFSNII